MTSKLFVYAATRTPFTRMDSDLAPLYAADLGRHVVSSLLVQTGIDPAQLAEVIFGCVGQPADSANIARVIALRAGIPESVPAATVQRNCASGIEALATAQQRLAAHPDSLFIAGGTESMSSYPLIFNPAATDRFKRLVKARSLSARLAILASFRPSHFSPVASIELGLTDPISGLNMGQTAEILAREWNISRDEQDAFAAESHRKAEASRTLLDAEISPIAVNGKAVTSDNGIRANSSRESLAKLRPVFDRKYGSVTAGNSSQLTDGAAAMLVGPESMAKELGIEPIGRIIAFAFTGCDPARMGLGPVKAIAAANAKAKLSLDDADCIEINEAFAAQTLAVIKSLTHSNYAKKAGLSKPLGDIPPEKLNPRGGAIALGHPVGASGARLVLTALSHLQHTGGKRALVSLCIGGGQGAALWLERP